MTFKPAHKQDDATKAPGQYQFDRHPYLKHSTAECCGNPLRGCADCPPVKLTFDAWLRQSSFIQPDAGTYQWMKDCWKAAQENK